MGFIEVGECEEKATYPMGDEEDDCEHLEKVYENIDRVVEEELFEFVNQLLELHHPDQSQNS